MSYTVRLRGAPRAYVQEFACGEHGVFSSSEEADTDHARCPACGLASPWRISAPAGVVRMVEAARGISDKPAGALAMSTRALAEGMPVTEWRAQRARAWGEVDHAANRSILRGH